ncbi:MAG: ribosome biogenesis GTPase YlqF [Acholeplasmataceae bacterium]
MNWYPGHMAKALREIKEHMNKVDIIYLLLDARLPLSSINPIIKDIASHKPMLYLYNKSTLADLNKLSAFIEDENYLIIDALKRENMRQIPLKTKEMLVDLIQKKQQQGYKNYTIKAMIVGIPNVGKSTLANALSKRKSASTDAKPGHTRALQWIKIDQQIQLLDTPGVLWPKFEDPLTMKRLALAGSIKEEIVNKEALFTYAYHYLDRHYKDYLSYYDVPYDTLETFITNLQERRNLTLDGLYTLVLNDIKLSKLGGICFDL